MKKKYMAVVLIALILCSTLSLVVSCKSEEDNVTSYSIWLDVGDDNTVECSQRVNVVNNYGVSLDELKFNVYANAFDSQKPLTCAVEEQNDYFPNGVSFGKFQLGEIYGDFKEYDFDFDSNILAIRLDAPLEAGKSIGVDMRYTLTLPNTHGRYGFNQNGICLTGFYPMLCAFQNGVWTYDEYSPIGDPYFSDVANYDVTFNVPDGWQYAASGKSREFEQDGENLVASSAKYIRDFALILSPTLNKTTTNHSGVQITYLGDKSGSVEYAQSALDIYGNMFGKYAYDSIAIVDMPFNAGGMEYGALCVVNESLSGKTYEEVVAHEIAHQWWYGAVGSNNLCEAWQDEGLTSYATYLYFTQRGDVEYSSLIMSDAYAQFQRFIDIQKSVGESAKGKLGGRLKEFPGNYYYTNITYNKALIMWKYMQDTIGKNNVLNALQEYYSVFKFRIASPDDLYACLDGSYLGASKLMQTWVASV